MPLTDNDMNGLIALVREASVAAILPRFRALAASQIATKTSDDDLVTDADREAEAMIADGVLRHWPGTVVIGEEAVSEGRADRAAIATAERAVIIDPVDGTWNFARGLALFGVIVAVVERGETVAGLLYDPLGNDTVHARAGAGAFYTRADGTSGKLTTAPHRPAADMAGFSGHALMTKPLQERLALPLTRFRRVAAFRCSCHEYRLMAQGHMDFCLTGGLQPWDHAAGELIVREAGGHAALIDGTPYRPSATVGPLLTASSRVTWEAAADILRPAFEGT